MKGQQNFDPGGYFYRKKLLLRAQKTAGNTLEKHCSCADIFPLYNCAKTCYNFIRRDEWERFPNSR